MASVCSAAPGAAPKASGLTAATVPMVGAFCAIAGAMGAKPTPIPPEIKPTPSNHSRLIMAGAP
ncbi:hypothetical protein DLREEDagr8_33980 [Dongia sp. agr-C8]